MNITELTDSLKAAAEKATPGEWVYFPKNTSIEYDVGSDESQGSILYVDSGDFTQAQTDRNGEFIALANPANVKRLVEALEKAQQERDNWRTSFDNERFRADKLKAHIDEMTEEQTASINELSRIIQKEVKAKREAEKRIAELESRTVTVKMPKLKMLEDYLAEVAVEERKAILLGVRMEFHRALNTESIKLEDE
ncbi:ead/Ea22-like family protein [Klebsiella michiganensis]|uniref:ead/Ea22-like family protein n=1 Tax=Klebsiella michiganensis TaxID=1134687 RepID=UPI002DB8E69A|nr:ead/Ea22-like family protein [Klebsiella michiganensis]MEB8291577.1 ead/Ea22-like family protein [Klebsiella michiganensis]